MDSFRLAAIDSICTSSPHCTRQAIVERSARSEWGHSADQKLMITMACLVQWGEEVQLLSIAANRNESISMVEEVSRARRLPRVLLDEDHVVADRYQAVTTPHVFVVDREGLLRYRGAVDDVTFRQRKATRFYLEEAVEALLENRLPDVQETPAYGCTIVREI